MGKFSGSWGKSVVSFSADISSFVHDDNKKKDILVLNESTTQGLDDTTIKASYILLVLHNQKKICVKFAL